MELYYNLMYCVIRKTFEESEMKPYN